LSDVQSNKRDLLRATILATHQPKSRLLEFFGVEIELRQPLLGDILKAQSEQNPEIGVINTLISQAFVPGTDERIFEEGDIAVLRLKPFDANFLRVAKALEELSEVNFLDRKAS
jgi:hypothetical protein